MSVTRPSATNNRPDRDMETVNFTSIRMLEIEISRPLPYVSAYDEQKGHTYRRALSLVRLHTQPLGLIELHLDADGLTPLDYARQIWCALGSQITAHLREDGLPAVTALQECGIATTDTPRCVQHRERFLAHAPLVSVIIPTSNRTDRLAVCLDSLLASRYPNFEIIVVDSIPKTSATADLLRDAYGALPQVRYIREDRPGSSAARNRGLTIAKGEIVAFTDDDVVVDAYWLAEMAKGFRAADNVGCVTGLIIPMELETQAQVWFEQYGGFSKGVARQIYDLGRHRPSDPLFPYNAGMFGSGNSMAFNRTVLRKVGNFDPMLGNNTPALGGVDIDAFFRIVINGYQLVYEPAAIVHHAHRRDYAGLRKQVYSFAAGTTAFQMKSILAHPRLLPGFIAIVPAGLRFILSPQSDLNKQKRRDYPEELTVLDRKGMLYGPLAYLRSWWWWHVSLPLNRRWRVK